MKTITVLCILSVAYCLYTDIDDSIDIDAIVKNETEYRKYMDCFLNKQPCTKPMTGYKKHIRDALAEDCGQCTLKEKHVAEKILTTMDSSYPEDFAQLRAMYDPQGKYFDRLFADMAKY